MLGKLQSAMRLSRDWIGRDDKDEHDQGGMQEVAPGIAMDSAQIISIDEEMDTPVGDFEDVLKVRETTSLEPGLVEFKYYAPGVGLINDGELELVKYGWK